MRKSAAACMFMASLLIAETAAAATLSTVQGTVLVNRGKGFRTASQGGEVQTGDNIMARPGGSATVTFPNGCTMRVDPGTVFTVPPMDHCLLAAAPIETIAVGAAAIGAGVYLLTKKSSASP